MRRCRLNGVKVMPEAKPRCPACNSEDFELLVLEGFSLRRRDVEISRLQCRRCGGEIEVVVESDFDA